MTTLLTNARPSTTTWMFVAVLTHETECQRPSLSAGPAMSSAYLEPLKPQDAWPVGWYSILNSPPAVVYWPLRIRSQSGVAGLEVVFSRSVTVRLAEPGLRSERDGTVTWLLPENRYARPRKPAWLIFTPESEPLCPPTESTIVVPDVSSMCQSATVFAAKASGAATAPATHARAGTRTR